MAMPRVRFTIRRLLVMIVAAALLLASFVGIRDWQRRQAQDSATPFRDPRERSCGGAGGYDGQVRKAQERSAERRGTRAHPGAPAQARAPVVREALSPAMTMRKLEFPAGTLAPIEPLAEDPQAAGVRSGDVVQCADGRGDFINRSGRFARRDPVPRCPAHAARSDHGRRGRPALRRGARLLPAPRPPQPPEPGRRARATSPCSIVGDPVVKLETGSRGWRVVSGAGDPRPRRRRRKHPGS